MIHDTISAKDGDFTSETINKLIKDGYESSMEEISSIYITPAKITYYPTGN